MQEVVGFSLFVVGTLLCYAALTFDRRALLCPYRLRGRKRVVVATFLGWMWWSIGITLIPHERLAAWVEFGGVWHSLIALVIVVVVYGDVLYNRTAKRLLH